jgi:hypothetical protein
VDGHGGSFDSRRYRKIVRNPLRTATRMKCEPTVTSAASSRAQFCMVAYVLIGGRELPARTRDASGLRCAHLGDHLLRGRSHQAYIGVDRDEPNRSGGGLPAWRGVQGSYGLSAYPSSRSILPASSHPFSLDAKCDRSCAL